MTKTIAELSEEIHSNAKAKGFWEQGLDLPKMLMLTVSELSEAMEADRKDKIYRSNHFLKELDINEEVSSEDEKYFQQEFEVSVKNTIQDELADAMIRIMDIAQYMNIDLQWHIQMKMKYNELRPYKHGKKY